MSEIARIKTLAGILDEAALVQGMPHSRYAQAIHQTIKDALGKLPGEELQMLLYSLADDIRFLKIAMERQGMEPAFDVEIRELDAAAPRSFDSRSAVEKARGFDAP